MRRQEARITTLRSCDADLQSKGTLWRECRTTAQSAAKDRSADKRLATTALTRIDDGAGARLARYRYTAWLRASSERAHAL
jgi:hypothetical protein